ncbi:MAG TPA: class I SAM-dependent methyltransferase [Terracidiphilus sp.]|jgi:2-polyprenyl-3-methyl-5-hydroxy-6-metoxy-1,4-benzoquinol methylase
MNQRADRVLARLLDMEKADTSGVEARQKYLATHGPRFAEILQLSRRLVPDSAARVLDIGRSELTARLASHYRDVRSLGFDPRTDDGGHREARELDEVPHVTFDLLNARDVSEWPQCGPFDLIVFSEVIEHLHVAPAYVLAFLGSLLSPQGVLICTTPNAVSSAKRILMVTGRNPYEQLRFYSHNPGHIREYTRDELVAVAAEVGLECKSHSYNNWIRREKGNPIKMAVLQLLDIYPAFRRFQTFVFARTVVSGWMG